jgi:hypothetical protein
VNYSKSEVLCCSALETEINFVPHRERDLPRLEKHRCLESDHCLKCVRGALQRCFRILDYVRIRHSMYI